MNHTAMSDELKVALPPQMGGRMRGAARPELRLLAAVLEDAWSCLGSRRGKEFREACEWVLDDAHDWPFSFANVCEVLGLDANAVRRRLQSIIERRRPHADPPGVLADTRHRHVRPRR
jgi:hypothetical protein